MPSPDDSVPSTDDGPTATDDRASTSRRRVLRTSTALGLATLAGCNAGHPRSRSTSSATDPGVVTSSGPTTDESDGTPPFPELRGPWPTAHADAANTSAVDNPGPQGPPAVNWQAGLRLETELTVASGPDGPVATQRNGTVIAYDQDGRVRWRRTHDEPFTAAPVVATDGTVVVGTRDGTVTAYDPDGGRRWRKSTLDGLFAPHANDATPFRIVDDVVFLAHPHGSAYAFELDDGVAAWQTQIPRRCHRPAVADGKLLLASRGSRRDDESVLLALRTADGSEAWRTAVDAQLSIAAGVNDDLAYVGSIDGRLSAHTVADGTERWSVQLDADERRWISSIPTAFAGQVWVGTLDNGLYAVDAHGVQSHVALDTGTTPVVGDGRLYVGSTDFGSEDSDANGLLVAVDPEGSVVWRTETRGHPESEVHYRDGRVVFGTDSGVLASFDAASGERAWRAFERPASLPKPVVGDGALYCGNLNDAVSGYDVMDGKSHLWHVTLDGPTPGAPVVAGDTIIAGSQTGDVAGTPPHEHADPPTAPLTKPDRTTTTVHVDAPSPEPRWRTDLDRAVGDFGYGTDGESGTTSGARTGGAFVGAGTRVVALTGNGDVRWERDVGERVSTSPAVYQDIVVATTESGTVLAHAADDGTVSWTRDAGGVATAPVVADGSDPTLVVVGTDNGVRALSAFDGTDVWSAEGPRVRGAPAVADGSVVAADDAGRIRALNLETGDEAWRVETAGAVHGSPAIAAETVYIGNRASKLYAVNLANGSVDWTFEMADWVDGSPVVAYGAVFVATQAGTIEAVVADPD